MPWTCEQCGTHVEVETTRACPSCAAEKTAWTVAPDVTRALVLAAKQRLQCLAAPGEDPPADAVAYAEAAWSPTQVAPALARASLRELRAEGLFPAPRDVLTVRVTPGKVEDWTLALGPRHAWGEVQTQDYPQEGRELDAQGSFDARFLCVYGPRAEGEQDPELEGLALVDVSEDEGLAPELEVSGLKRRPLRLRLQPPGDYWLAARFHDRVGRLVTGLRFRIEDPVRGQEGEVGADGTIRLPCFDPQDYLLRFEGGDVLLASVHDPELVAHVCLRFVAPGGGAAPEYEEQAPEPWPQPPEETGDYPAYDGAFEEGQA